MHGYDDSPNWFVPKQRTSPKSFSLLAWYFKLEEEVVDIWFFFSALMLFPCLFAKASLVSKLLLNVHRNFVAAGKAFILHKICQLKWGFVIGNLIGLVLKDKTRKTDQLCFIYVLFTSASRCVTTPNVTGFVFMHSGLSEKDKTNINDILDTFILWKNLYSIELRFHFNALSS